MYNKLKRFFDRHNFYYQEDVTDEGRKFFRLQQRIAGSETLGIVLVFDEKETVLDIIVFNIATVSDHGKYEELLKIINELNAKYKFWKFIASKDGEVRAEYNLVVESELSCKAVILPIELLVCCMSEDGLHKSLKRLQWL